MDDRTRVPTNRRPHVGAPLEHDGTGWVASCGTCSFRSEPHKRTNEAYRQVTDHQREANVEDVQRVQESSDGQ